MYTVTYFLFDIVAVGYLVHIHHSSFKACSLESLKEFKNCCLLSEHFVIENGCEVSQSGDGESEPDINYGGKFKSVLIDVNKTAVSAHR